MISRLAAVRLKVLVAGDAGSSGVRRVAVSSIAAITRGEAVGVIEISRFHWSLTLMAALLS